MLRLRDKRGFSLIELLMVLAIIGLLAAVAIPGYLGFQDRAREASIVRAAEGSASELSFWIQISLSSRATNREADTNFDGKIDGNDNTNAELKTNGVAVTYADGKNNVLNEKSPWFLVPLWSTDSSMPDGRITLVQLSDSFIRIVAKNKSGRIIFEKSVFAD